MSGHLWQSATRASVAAALIGTLWLGLGAPPAHAEREFGQRYFANTRGDIIGTGNTLLTCLDVNDDPTCPTAKEGGWLTNGKPNATNNNNSRPMRYVDVDGDGSTFNSSSAKLSLPANANVLWAGLYWGGRWQAGANYVRDNKTIFIGKPAPAPGLRDTVKLRAPGGTGYVAVKSPAWVDEAPAKGTPLPNETPPNRIYQGFADITEIVRIAGEGDYMVADAQLGIGLHADQSGGWSILVAYENPGDPQQGIPADPLRNLTVFDGLKFVSTDVPANERVVDIFLKGFLTPPAPSTVKTRLGLLAYEGDIGTQGDTATLNYDLGPDRDTELTNAANPKSNVFNSSITTPLAENLTDRSPKDQNNFGLDIDFFEGSFLANGQQKTVLRLTTDGDGYAPGVVLFSTDLLGPKIAPIKSVDRTVAQLDDQLTYTITVANTGDVPATDVVLTDAIPPYTDVVADSFMIDGNAAGGRAGVVSGNVVFRLGDGATNTAGGELAGGRSTTVQYKVQVRGLGVPQGAQIPNTGNVSYRATTITGTGSASTNTVTTTVNVPDLAITKGHTGEFEVGGSATFEIDVRNVGKAPTKPGTVVTDMLPPGVTLNGTPRGEGWTCTATEGGFGCVRDPADSLAAGATFPTILAPVRIADDADARRLVNVATVTTRGDPNQLNDTARDGPFLDLAIQKLAVETEVFPEDEVRYVITVRNNGGVRATDVVVSEVLPLDLSRLTVTPDKGTCSNRTCKLGVLVPDEEWTIRVSGVADRDSGGRAIVNTARVDAKERETDQRNNVDTAVVNVKSKADLVVEKTAAAPTLPAGGTAQFLVVVRNDGPSTATGVMLEDIVPPGLEALAFAPSQGTCTRTSCSLGDVLDGGVVEVLVFLRSSPGQAGQTFANLARAAAVEFDPDLGNNQDEAEITLTSSPPGPEANVVVTKTVDRRLVTVGDVVTFTVTAENRGPGAASSVMLSDGANPAIEVLSAEPSQGSCVIARPTTCELGALMPGATATLVVRARFVAAAVTRNAAAVIFPESDPSPPDSIAVASVAARADVRLSKRASRTTVRSGGRVTFTLTAQADGITEVANALLCDRLPAGLSVLDTNGGRLRAGRVCWRLGRLEPERPRTVRLVVRAANVPSATRVVNVARLTGAGVPAGRRAAARVRIIPAAGRRGGVTG